MVRYNDAIKHYLTIIYFKRAYIGILFVKFFKKHPSNNSLVCRVTLRLVLSWRQVVYLLILPMTTVHEGATIHSV